MIDNICKKRKYCFKIIRYYSQNICKTRKYYIKIIRYYCQRVLSQSALCRCSLLAACTLLWRRWGRKQNRTFETISILCSVILIIFMITLITIMILEGGKRGPMAWTSISSQANHFPFPLFLYFFFQSHSQPAIVQVNCLGQKNISFCNKFYEGCDLPPVHTSWRWLSGSSFSILKMEKRFQLQNWHIIAFILKQDSEPPDILHPLHYSLLCVLFHRASYFWKEWQTSCEIEIELITFSPQVESMQLGWEQHCVAQWWWGRLLIKRRKHWGEQVWEEEDRERM